MNKEQILNSTPKQIESYLNEELSSLQTKSIDTNTIKGDMIDLVTGKFNEDVEVSVPYYDNREIVLSINRINICFKVSCKSTGKIKKISRLRSKDIKQAGKFKFDQIKVMLEFPFFEEIKSTKYKVKHVGNFSSERLYFTDKNTKIQDIVTKERLIEEIQKYEEYPILREQIILNAAQDEIKNQYFKPNFDQSKWDSILKKVGEANKDLIDKSMEEMLQVI